MTPELERAKSEILRLKTALRCIASAGDKQGMTVPKMQELCRQALTSE